MEHHFPSSSVAPDPEILQRHVVAPASTVVEATDRRAGMCAEISMNSLKHQTGRRPHET
jgi:hypothetical protein